jgi:hypothetical protein
MSGYQDAFMRSSFLTSGYIIKNAPSNAIFTDWSERRGGCEAEASAPDNPQVRFVEKFSDAK